MVDKQPRRGAVTARALIGGTLVVLSLPILAPLILGTLITSAINGVYVLTRGLRSDRRGDD